MINNGLDNVCTMPTDEECVYEVDENGEEVAELCNGVVEFCSELIDTDVDSRLLLLIEKLDSLPESERMFKDESLSGKEIARLIPNVEAFLAALSCRRDPRVLGINEDGQLVIMDGCEPGGLGDSYWEAVSRQSAVWYLNESGEVEYLQGENLYTRKLVNDTSQHGNGFFYVLQEIEHGQTPIMRSGLPTIGSDYKVENDYVRDFRYTGEGAMISGEALKRYGAWMDGTNSDGYFASYLVHNGRSGDLRRYSSIGTENKMDNIGSVGVLRVNLGSKSVM